MIEADVNFKLAVNGWKQSVKIIEDLHKSLEFSLGELNRISKENCIVLGEDKSKAEKYYKGCCTLNTASRYLKAMKKANV